MFVLTLSDAGARQHNDLFTGHAQPLFDSVLEGTVHVSLDLFGLLDGL